MLVPLAALPWNKVICRRPKSLAVGFPGKAANVDETQQFEGRDTHLGPARLTPAL